jgi:CheY-like chemotaxis protein
MKVEHRQTLEQVRPTRRVPVVDDHASLRSCARTLLESEGFEVVGEAADGGSAVSVAAEFEPEMQLPSPLDAVKAAAGFALASERALRTVQTIGACNRALLGAIPAPMLLIDAAGTYLDVRGNESAEPPLGPEELIGLNIRDVAPPRVAEAIAQAS